MVFGWLVLLVIGFSNGALRQVTYGRALPEPAANALSVAIGLALMGTAVWWLTRAWPLASPAQAWRVGALWLALTLAFETWLGRVGGRSWEAILHEYALWEGRLWVLVPLFLLVAPRLALAHRKACAGRGAALQA